MPLTQQPVSSIGIWPAERRSNRRLFFRLNIVLRLSSATGEAPALEKTVATNISPGDMFFETSLGNRLSIGDRVSVDIELPADAGSDYSPRHLEASGRVVRLQKTGPKGTPSGAAIVFDKRPEFHKAAGA